MLLNIAALTASLLLLRHKSVALLDILFDGQEQRVIHYVVLLQEFSILLDHGHDFISVVLANLYQLVVRVILYPEEVNVLEHFLLVHFSSPELLLGGGKLCEPVSSASL